MGTHLLPHAEILATAAGASGGAARSVRAIRDLPDSFGVVRLPPHGPQQKRRSSVTVLSSGLRRTPRRSGVRTMGADAARVQRMILREGSGLVALGLALGIADAFASAGVIRRLLFGIASHDPVTFIGVAVTMAAIGIVACWIPALRAARIDPAIAMRSE
jgi:hypothetical protein